VQFASCQSVSFEALITIALANLYADNILPAKPAINWPVAVVTAFFKRRWVYHTVFWLLFYSLFSLMVVFGVYHIRDVVFYLQLLPIYLLDIALVYFNFYVLMPRLLARKKYLYYGLALSIAIVSMALVNIALKRMYAHFGSILYSYTADFSFTNIMSSLIERFYAVLLTAVIKIAKDGVQSQRLIQKKENQLLEAELNFLKSQIQPHFFFNTLNNLYSLTLKKSDEAPEVVLKLSDLMSYMLYETNTPRVALNKEILYLQNYIDLERLRFNKNLSLEFTIEGQTDGVFLPPLILILFIENAFKHGARNNLNSLEIKIDLTVEDGFLFFAVWNPAADNGVVKNKSGIGLKNARRRLELLYGDRYSLDEVKIEKEYTVSLKIPV